MADSSICQKNPLRIPPFPQIFYPPFPPCFRFMVLFFDRARCTPPEGQSSLPAGPMSENAARLNIGNARFFAARAMLEPTVSVHPHGTNTLDKNFLSFARRESSHEDSENCHIGMFAGADRHGAAAKPGGHRTHGPGFHAAGTGPHRRPH